MFYIFQLNVINSFLQKIWIDNSLVHKNTLQKNIDINNSPKPIIFDKEHYNDKHVTFQKLFLPFQFWRKTQYKKYSAVKMCFFKKSSKYHYIDPPISKIIFHLHHYHHHCHAKIIVCYCLKSSISSFNSCFVSIALSIALFLCK